MTLIPDQMPESWGPSEEELANTRLYEFHESTVVQDSHEQPDDIEDEGEEEEGDDDDDDDDDDDGGLLEAIEESEDGYSEID